MKTIEYKSKIYQIGAVYEFSDDCKSWFVDTLESFDLSGTILGKEEAWGYMRECQSQLGTITDAPLKLEDGCWYFCETATVGGACLKYTEQSRGLAERWFNGVLLFRCDDNYQIGKVTPLYKMVKA
jgi:hypothetical protein